MQRFFPRSPTPHQPTGTSLKTGSGSVTVSFDHDTGIWFADYSFTINGVIPATMHFHLGSLGVNGSVLRNIRAAVGEGDAISSKAALTCSGTRTDANSSVGQPIVSALFAAPPSGDTGILVNVHSAENPGGAIRGQAIAPVPLPGALPLMGAGPVGPGLLAHRRKAI
jgi:hypothetical protein